MSEPKIAIIDGKEYTKNELNEKIRLNPSGIDWMSKPPSERLRFANEVGLTQEQKVFYCKLPYQIAISEQEYFSSVVTMASALAQSHPDWNPDFLAKEAMNRVDAIVAQMLKKAEVSNG